MLIKKNFLSSVLFKKKKKETLAALREKKKACLVWQRRVVAFTHEAPQQGILTEEEGSVKGPASFSNHCAPALPLE